jgi:hypothetical protein
MANLTDVFGGALIVIILGVYGVMLFQWGKAVGQKGRR